MSSILALIAAFWLYLSASMIRIIDIIIIIVLLTASYVCTIDFSKQDDTKIRQYDVESVG